MINTIVITPEEYKRKSEKLKIFYGRHASPFGECLVGITGPEKSVCFLWFIDDNYDDCISIMNKEWPEASFVEDSSVTLKTVDDIFSKTEPSENLSIVLRGTDFQVKVWKALLEIPKGQTVTYSEIAEKIGSKAAVRAAGTAMKANRIAYIVPCHRVTDKSGNNKYRWGADRRRRIMEHEMSCDR